MNYSRIPFDWFEYRRTFGRFITYWGDIYTGTLWECPGYEGGFFIIPNNHFQEISQLNEIEKTPEKFRALGFEINDYRVIVEKYIVNLQKQEFNTNRFPSISKNGLNFQDMIILGAGASSFCCFDNYKDKYEKDPWRSPLGYDIFNERYDQMCKQYLGVKLAIPEFELKGNTIEECLEADWNKYSKSYLPDLLSRHINIQFYLQQLFQKISLHCTENYFRKNLYVLLINQLKDKINQQSTYRPVFVNFNYDTILDQFLEQSFGFKTEKLHDYIDWNNKEFVHFKPHGSCNWGWYFPETSIEQFGTKIAEKLFEEKIHFAKLYYELLGDYREMVHEYSYGIESKPNTLGKYSLDKNQIRIVDSKPAYPAILLPFKEKDEFVMPYYHQTALSILMEDVRRLFVIGWKGSERLFLEKLENAKNIQEIYIINPQFEDVKRNLEGHIKNDCNWIHVKDFETFIKERMINGN